MEPSPKPTYISRARWTFAWLALAFGAFFFILPGLRSALDLMDSGITSGKIPGAAWRLHENLAGPYADWAEGRMKNKQASKITGADVSGSEWPLFGSVFYLISLESLQKAWDADHSLASVAPNILARRSIEAAANLVTDPEQAHWARQYWGKNDYLHYKDLFYRFLLISAMTSYTNLTGNPRFMDALRDQVETLSAEIDATPVGLIEDYPGQCYPGDIIAALAAIHRADAVLHTDHSVFLDRAKRGFIGKYADHLGLPTFMSDAHSGEVEEEGRGSSNAYVLMYGAEIWPELAAKWRSKSETYFWQERWGMVGYRELPMGTDDQYSFMDVDSGPVLLNFGFAASAFGVGAARVQGRLDRAGPLMSEMLVSTWPLPNGTLLLPHMLSDATDAPYLGEVCILNNLTREPIHGVLVPCSSSMTPFVFAVLGTYILGSIFFALPLLNMIWSTRRQRAISKPSPAENKDDSPGQNEVE